MRGLFFCVDEETFIWLSEMLIWFVVKSVSSSPAREYPSTNYLSQPPSVTQADITSSESEYVPGYYAASAIRRYSPGVMP